jgi:thioredoxin 1
MVSYRSLLLAGVLAGALLNAAPALAADWKPFSADALSAAQKDGKPILVDITAPWCPVCRAQQPILEKLTDEPQYKDMVVLTVDFDHQKPDVRALKAQSQSTLIVFKGQTEAGRSVGDTNAASIAALLKSSL